MYSQDAFFIAAAVIILLVSAVKLQAQYKTDGETIITEREGIRQMFLNDSLKKKDTSDNKFVMHKSPLKAVLFSAVLPGAGQFYNESYWKIPVIWGIGGYFIYEMVRNNNKFLDYRDLYAGSQTEQNPQGDARLKTLREFYRDQRDQFILYFGIVYLINVFDAYVDAHLYDFDVSDKVKVGLLKKNLVELKINF